MQRRQWIFATALLAGGTVALGQTPTPAAAAPATTAPAAPRRAASPAGTAATQVGGTWSAPDKDGEPRYSGGKWIEIDLQPADPARPRRTSSARAPTTARRSTPALPSGAPARTRPRS